MGDRNNYQGEIDAFRRNFLRFREKRIVLYGIGRFTATLIPGIPDFNLVGLMDRDSSNIGKVMYGLPVISGEEAKHAADIVIINAAETYWRVIYDRISGLGIPVYFLDGKLASEETESGDYWKDPYWQKDYAGLQKKIKEYDVISFDVFDTLIMRKVFFPIDIYKLADLRIQEKWGMDIGFFKERVLAGAGSDDRNLSLDEIYAKMNGSLHLTEEMLQQIKKIEIETECRTMVPRRDMVDILNAVPPDKEVWIISDMYLPAEIMKEILEQCGVRNTENVWVSAERKKNKKSGQLWQEYVSEVVKGRKALHIGDNLQSDVRIPQKYGIAVYQVLSAAEMLKRSSAGGIVPYIQSLGESVFAGLLCSRMFNSPFALNESKGRVMIRDFEGLGYCVFGGVLCSFLSWLVQQGEQRSIDRFVFLARDGYWLQKNYDFLKKLSGWSKAPKSSYLAISRRLIMIAAFQCEEDLKEIIQYPYSGIFSEYMHDRLDIDICTDDVHAGEEICLPQDYDRVMEWMSPYYGEMLETVREEKKNYLKYLDGQKLNEQDGIVDLWFYGNNQYYLSKTLGKRLTGFYFVVNKDRNNRCGRDNILVPCFQKNDDQMAKKSHIYKSSLWLESFLTAPYGMIKAVSQDGGYICDEGGRNQKFWESRERIYDGICVLEKEYAAVFWGKPDQLEPEFIDRFWKEVVKEHITLTHSLKKVFFTDNGLVKRWEMGIFE